MLRPRSDGDWARQGPAAMGDAARPGQGLKATLGREAGARESQEAREVSFVRLFLLFQVQDNRLRVAKAR